MNFSLKSSNSKSNPVPSVVGLPGHVFFCRRLDLPSGMEAAEVSGFVELQLEELSPFPLDQLYFGHVISADRKAVFIYAAYKRRIPPEQSAAWADVAFVIPDFAPATKLTFESDTVVYLRSALSMSALYFEANRELPARVASLPLSEDASPQELDRTKSKLSEKISAGGADEVSRRIAGNPEDRAKGRAFTIESESDGAPWEVVVSVAERWMMDVRDASFLAAKRRQLGFDVVLWRIVQGAVAVIALLVVGEILLLGSHGYGAYLDARIEKRTPLAKSLEDHDSVARRMDEFEGGDLLPFEMLNLLAASMPDNLSFASATVVGRNTLEADATARSVADINDYRARLGNIPEIEKFEFSNERTRADGTTFKAVITFRIDLLAAAETGGGT